MRTLIRALAVSAPLLAAGCKHEVPSPRTEEAPSPTAAASPAVATAPLAAGAPQASSAPIVAPTPTEELPLLPPAPPVAPPPIGLPLADESPDNPTTPEKVALGYVLFFDKRLSRDGSLACVGCHYPAKAWTDDRVVSQKVGGALNKRNAPTVLNLAYATHGYYWDGRKPTLEATAAAAWSSQLGADPQEAVARLNRSPMYRAHFQRAFGAADATPDTVAKALAAFLRSLKSGHSPWDRFEAGDAKAVGAEAKHGFEVFKKAGCALCHVPPLYSDFDFHNAGIGADLPGESRDPGRMDASHDPKDDGKFKTPSLRDVAKTAPYFHDGSVKTLDEAIAVMAGGGKANPNLDPKLKPAKLPPRDLAALRAFLESLSGEGTRLPPPEMPPQ